MQRNLKWRIGARKVAALSSRRVEVATISADIDSTGGPVAEVVGGHAEIPTEDAGGAVVEAVAFVRKMARIDGEAEEVVRTQATDGTTTISTVPHRAQLKSSIWTVTMCPG